MHRGRGWTVLALGLVALIALYGLRAHLLAPLGHFLVVADPLRPADAIVALAGDPRRLLHAAALHDEGLAPWLLLTELPLDTAAERERHLASSRRIVTSGGVPESSVLHVPGVATTTYGEAVNLRAFVEDRGFDALIVVTSPWHTRRARMVFRDAFRGSTVSVSVQPMRDDVYLSVHHTYRPDEWWTYRLGRLPTMQEYLKIVAHVVGIR
jgi:uncharacterized SAM-binding protein YcdF (DUF218 family)